MKALSLVSMVVLALTMTVGEMSNQAVTTAADDTVLAAAERMESEGIGALVVEANETVESLITDREIALAVAEHGGDLSGITVEEVMTEEVVTIEDTQEGLVAAREMAQQGVRRIPVVDRTDSLVGIVTLDDVVALAGEQLADAATVIEQQSPGYEP
jgi:CBS domain-containing protein